MVKSLHKKAINSCLEMTTNAPAKADLRAKKQGKSPIKVIIDTDPGIDDAFAVLMSLSCAPELRVLALTSSFGNVRTEKATENCKKLLRIYKSSGSRKGSEDEKGDEKDDVVYVAEGSKKALNGKQKEHIADFVHGKDGFGDFEKDKEDLLEAKEDVEVYPGGSAKLMYDLAKTYPGEVTIICLATATNVVNAFREYEDLPKMLRSVVHLGGAYTVSGNVNPAAEANVYADAEAADELYGTHGVDIYAVGLDVTMNVRMTEENLIKMRDTKYVKGRETLTDEERQFLFNSSQFYMNYHIKSLNFRGVLQHDSVCVMTVIHPEMFEWTRARVRVATESFARGMVIMDKEGEKNWSFENAWTERPLMNVALTADFEAIEKALMERFI